MNVLIDTTIWSLAFRKKSNTNIEIKIGKFLTELIQDGRVKIIGPIRQEVLSGIALPNDFHKLQKKLAAFEDLPITTEDYERAAEIFNLCRKKGIQGSHIDFLICAVAEHNHLSLFTLDKDFTFYKKHCRLMLFKNHESL